MGGALLPGDARANRDGPLIRKTGNGPRPWRARVIGADGKKLQRSFTTKSGAQEWERQQLDRKAAVTSGLEVDAGPITLNDLIDLFLANRPARKSDDWLKRMLEHPRAKFGDQLVRAIRPEEVGRWLHGLRRSPKTKHHILTALRQVFDQAIEWGYLTKNPARTRAVESPGQKRVTPIQPFESWDEALTVAAAAGAHKLDRHGVSEGLIRFACATGVRVPSELLALTPEHVDRETKTLTVPGTKTANAERVIPMSQLALDALELIPWPLQKSSPLFPINYHQWRRTIWPDALTETGVSYRPPYEMRHTFATLALEARVPIESLTELMGHASFETTRKFYARFTRRRLDEDVALLNNLSANAADTFSGADGHQADTT